MFIPVMSAPVEMPFDFDGLWKRALQRAGLKHEVVALLMGIPATLLSRQVQGLGHISLQRFCALAATADGRRFVRAFLIEFLKVTGLGDVDPVIDWLREGVAMVTRMRMAKAQAMEAEASRKRRIA